MTGRYAAIDDPVIVDPAHVLEASGQGLPEGPVVVDDPIGDWVGVGVAEWLAGAGRQVTLISPDPVAGSQLARTGDLADANVRLQRAGVVRQLRSVVTRVGDGVVEVEDAWTGEPGKLPATVLVDCGYRVPEDDLYRQADDAGVLRAGDCVAPRTILEAVLEGRRVATAVAARPA
jgi:2,4-dienoyl-CoA reductase (NADPH2)